MNYFTFADEVVGKKVPVKKCGAVAGRTRKDIEKRTGKKIVTKKNFLRLKQKMIKK